MYYNCGVGSVKCLYCAKPLRVAKTGRPKKFCWDRCRKAYARLKFPSVMVENTIWVRAKGKIPLQTDGRNAKVNDPATWATWAQVKSSQVGDGFGVMLGNGLACYDLDHWPEDKAIEFARALTVPVVWFERSMSGQGFHIFVQAPEQPGYRRDGVEFYSRARFIRLTGHKITI